MRSKFAKRGGGERSPVVEVWVLRYGRGRHETEMKDFEMREQVKLLRVSFVDFGPLSRL